MKHLKLVVLGFGLVSMATPAFANPDTCFRPDEEDPMFETGAECGVQITEGKTKENLKLFDGKLSVGGDLGSGDWIDSGHYSLGVGGRIRANVWTDFSLLGDLQAGYMPQHGQTPLWFSSRASQSNVASATGLFGAEYRANDELTLRILAGTEFDSTGSFVNPLVIQAEEHYDHDLFVQRGVSRVKWFGPEDGYLVDAELLFKGNSFSESLSWINLGPKVSLLAYDDKSFANREGIGGGLSTDIMIGGPLGGDPEDLTINAFGGYGTLGWFTGLGIAFNLD